MSTDTTDGRPSPVVDSAKIGRYIYSVGPLLAAVLTGLGYATTDQVDGALALVVTAVGAVAAVINFVVPVIRARRVRELVTPVSDPRAADGITPLVPEQIRPL